MTWCYEHLHPILCFASFQNLRKVYIVNVFLWCVWTQSDRLLIVTIFPLKLNSNPSPDFSVKRVLSGIKVVTRGWILTTFWKTDELNWNKQFLKFLRKKSFLERLDCVTKLLCRKLILTLSLIKMRYEEDFYQVWSNLTSILKYIVVCLHCLW